MIRFYIIDFIMNYDLPSSEYFSFRIDRIPGKVWSFTISYVSGPIIIMTANLKWKYFSD